MKKMNAVLGFFALISSFSVFADGGPLSSKTVTCRYTITCDNCGKSDVLEQGEIPVKNRYENAIKFEKKLRDGTSAEALVSFSPITDHGVPSETSGIISTQASIQTRTGKIDQAEGTLFYDQASYDKMFTTWMDGSRSSETQLVYLWSSQGYNVGCEISRE